MRMNLAGAFRVWLTVVACGVVVAPSLAQNNRPDILWVDSSVFAAFDVAFSPAQDLIATTSEGGTVKLWRISDGSFVRSFRPVPLPDFGTGVAFSPDGSKLVSAWWLGTLQVWNVSDGSLVNTLRPRQARAIPYQRAIFSRDGTLIAASSAGSRVGVNFITVWRAATGEQLAVLTLPTNIPHPAVTDFQFSPDGALLAASATTGSVYVWRLTDGALLRTISAHTGAAFSVNFTPDGAFLVTAGEDNAVRLWRVADGVLQRTVASGRIARLSPDGTLLAIAVGNSNTEIRRLKDGALVTTVNLAGAPVFSSDGSLLAAAQGFGIDPVRIWRLPEGTLVRELPSLRIESFAQSADGALIATVQKHSGPNQRIVLRNAADGALVRVIELQQVDIRGVAFVPNRDLLATVESDLTVTNQFHIELRLRRISDGTLVRTLGAYGLPAFSADGAFAAVAVYVPPQTLVRILRVEDGAIVRELPVEGSGIRQLSLSPDGSLVALINTRRNTQSHLWLSIPSLEVRRVADNALLFRQENTDGRLQFSADGARLALLGSTTQVWRTSDFTLLRTIEQPGVHSFAALSPDGALVATFSSDATIRFWRVDNGELLLTYDDETSQPLQVEFSPSGQRFIYLRTDSTLVVARNPFSESQQVGDLNGDGCVNNADLLLVLFNFGNAGGTGDANDDGVVNNADLLMVLFNFGRGC